MATAETVVPYTFLKIHMPISQEQTSQNKTMHTKYTSLERLEQYSMQTTIPLLDYGMERHTTLHCSNIQEEH